MHHVIRLRLRPLSSCFSPSITFVRTGNHMIPNMASHLGAAARFLRSSTSKGTRNIGHLEQLRQLDMELIYIHSTDGNGDTPYAYDWGSHWHQRGKVGK